MHSSWEIVKDARGDLVRAKAEPGVKPTVW
jgi:hypothetical protein